MARIVRGRRPVSRRPRGNVVALRAPRTYTVFTATVNNAGNAPTDATIEVAGPTTGGGFWVANDTTGKTLRVNFTVAASTTLVIDMAARTGKVAGVDQGAIFDHANSSWWQLAAGNNSIRASVPATIKHNSAYR